MKNVLRGTTALLAASLAASQAAADSGGIKLGVSGYYSASAGVLIGGDQAQTGPDSGQGDFGRTSGGFRQEIRISFKGQTTLDNGITVGALVGLNAENVSNDGGMVQNRSQIDFSGKYGDLRFGEGDSVNANSQTCVYDPGNVTYNFGVNSANQNFSNFGLAARKGGGTVVGVAGAETFLATCDPFAGKGTAVAYFSPSFGGFTLAVSYTPESGHRLASGSQGFGPGTDLKNAAEENVLDVGADYNHDFGGGWTLLVGGGGEWALSGGHTTSGAPIRDHKPSTYLLGFQIGIPGGFTVGASGQYYANYENQTANFAATNAFSVTDEGENGWVVAGGASYAVDDSLTLGLEGIYGQYQTWKDTPASGNDKAWAIGLTGTYGLGPGIALEAMAAYMKLDPNLGTPSFGNPMAYDAVELDTGVNISF